MKIANYLKTRLSKCSLVLSGLSASMMLLGSAQINAQNPTHFIKSDSHIGGYHIKCNGQSSGVLEAQPNFGIAPYTFLWNTGETLAALTDKTAGIYIVTATDANNNVQIDTFELKEPRPFSYELSLSDYNGYHVSNLGNDDGSIEILANGGTPPYQYLWNNGEAISLRKGLIAGAYNFTITDANQCLVNGTASLLSPTPIQLSFTNVQGTQCFEGKDGSASLNISGGLGDFSVVWDNGSFSLNPDDLHGGYNAVRIFEQGKAIIDTGIIISEPNAIASIFTLSDYNGYHVSCADCFNGSINTLVTGGTAPYSYHWDDISNSTTANLSSLNEGTYNLLITDAHGCTMKNSTHLKMPAPKDWSRMGNTNIDPLQYIGSADNSPVLFKINNQEVLKMVTDTVVFKSKIKLMDIDTSTFYASSKLLGIDASGNLKSFERGEILQGPSLLPPGCNGCGCSPVIGWGKPADMIAGVVVTTNTNDIVKCPADGNVGIGTTAPEANSKLEIIGEIAISGERLNVAYDGKVGIGTSDASEKLELFGGNFRVSCPWDYQNPVFFVDHANKNVGIGTSQPRGKFEIKINESDNLTFGAMGTLASGWASSYLGFNIFRESNGFWHTTGDSSNSGGSVIYSNRLGDLMFTNINGENAPLEVYTSDAGIKLHTNMTLTNDGRLGIGVNPKAHYDLLSYKLVVDGNIKCKKLRVDLQNWGDFVFESNYELMDLASIESYIAKNKHLPGMPSAEEVEKEGADIGEIVRMQQIKIEELTLLLIQMQKQIDLASNNK